MKQIKVLCFFALFISMISCNKSENPPAGYADKVAGSYKGIIYHGAVQMVCTSQIIKTADSEVKLTLIIGGSSYTTGQIAVTNAGNNTYNLSYTGQGDYLNGKVEGNTLNFSISQGVLNDVFTGSR